MRGIGTSLSSAPVLEDKEELKNWILTHVRPARNRRLYVEIMDACYDWQQWLWGLNSQISGLAATHKEKEHGHSWRFVSRSLAEKSYGEGIIEAKHPEWAALPTHPDDTIFLVKHFMHSSSLSQPPLLALPVGHSENLLAADIKVLCQIYY